MNNVTENLKAHLDSISLDEFIREWEDIVSLGIISPTVSDYIRYSEFTIKENSSGNYTFLVKNSTFTAPITEPFSFN